MPRRFEEQPSPEKRESRNLFCEDCKKEVKEKGGFIGPQIMGNCEKCGGLTSMKLLKLCRKCANEMQVCQNCVKPLDQSDDYGH